MIYFFQAGEKQDTIIKNKSDLFYLWVPDTLKEVIVITVDNAQFQKTDTDSLIKLVYVPGLKYESFYFKQKDPDPDESDTLPYEFRTHVNGAVTGDKNKILIQIYNKKENKLILENLFFFRRE